MTSGAVPSYVDTWYRRRCPPGAPRDALVGRQQADVCIIGGGLAGLSAALDLARAGCSVVVLEAQRIAWGASGRNGGFVSPGYSLGYDGVAARVGPEAAKALHAMSIEGMQIVAGNIRDLAIADAAPQPGILSAVRHDAGRGLQDHRDWLAQTFGYNVEHLDRAALGEHLSSPRYFQALHDRNAFHFDPLAYARALADAIEAAGGRIYEASPVRSISASAGAWVAKVAGGEVVEH